MKLIKKILTLFLVIMLSTISLLGNGMSEVKAATYKLTETQLFMQAPQYLYNESFNSIYTQCEDDCVTAIDSVSDTEVLVASYMEGLKSGSKYILKDVANQIGIATSSFDDVNKEVAGELLREYLGNADYMEGVSSDVSEQYGFITKSFDLASEMEKEKFINGMKANNKTYTDSEIDEIFSDNKLTKKILGSYSKTEDACKMLVTIVELHQIEIEAIDELLALENLDSALEDGLLQIRADATDNIVDYLFRTYGTDKLLDTIESNISGMTVETISASATICAKLIISISVYVYENYKPSVKDIVHATLLEGYTRTADTALSKLDTKFQTGVAKETDIAKYRVAYNFYTACLKQYMEACQKLVEKKNKRLYNRLGMYADELGTTLNYNSYLNACLSNATQAIDAGKLVITSDSVVHKTDDGTVIDSSYDSTASILAKLAEIQKQYPPNQGYVWNATYKGCYQCCGFARLVFNKLFGYDISAYVGNKRYMLSNESNVVKVGQLVGSEVTLSNVKSLFANAKVGDYIQVNGSTYGQHSAIFVGLTDTGILVYDCNSKPNGVTKDCVVNQWTMTYNNLVSWYSKPSSASNNGISVYRASNYNSIYGDGSNLFYDDSVNFVIQDGVLTKYNGWQTYVNIPDEVTAIGDGAFKNNTTMMNVEIPDSVTSIGNEAFYGCTALMGVAIPDSVESIGYSAFYNCTNLTDVFLPENEKFTTLSSSTFYNCSKLSDVKIPDSVTEINGSVFRNCSNLKNVDLPSQLVEIGAFVFTNTLIEKITIPKSLTTVNFSDNLYSTQYWGPFGDCTTLKNVTFEEGITTIPDCLFASCTGIEEIKIPNTVTKIKWGAFRECKNLQTADIPNSVTEIEGSVFRNCSNLKNVDLPSQLVEIGAFVFTNTLIEKITIPKSLTTVNSSDNLYSTQYWGPFGDCTTLKNVTFEEGITTIPECLFASCTGIEKIKIPNTVTKIKWGAFRECKNLQTTDIPNSVTEIEGSVFRNCSNLKNVDLPSQLVEIGAFVFTNTLIEKIIIPKSLTTVNSYDNVYSTQYWGPFGDCTTLKNVTFEEGITTIPECLFASCTGIEKIKIPNTVTKIKWGAFRECKNLQTTDIPNSVTEIEGSTFRNCQTLDEINLPNSVTSMGTSVFAGCTSLTKAHIPDIRINLMDSTFSGCTSLTEVNLPDTLQTIGSRAFYNCTSLTEINLPENVNTINSSAFSGCTALTKVTIPASMRKIYSSAFSHCEALTDLTIAEGTTTIYENAFEYCKALKSVILPDSLQTLGSYAFRYCDVLSEVNVGAGLKIIPGYCFYEDPALEKIILPQQVTTVNQYAFGNCTKFTDITMNRNVETITSNAFSYPDRLTIHGVSGTYPQTFAEENDITFVALNEPATAIKLSKTACDLARGYTEQLTANITPADSSDQLTWTSTDEDIVTVDESGLIKGIKTGTASIIAMAGDIVETCEVTVYEKVTSVSLNCSKKDMSLEDTLQLTATIYPSSATNKNISWSTSDETVASVDENGLVTAKTYGTATITVTTEDGSYTKSCTITVKPIAVTGVSLNAKTATIGIGNTYELIPTISPDNATVKDVTWTSSKPAVATVTDGIVTGVSEGTSTIIVKTTDGSKTATCTITVKTSIDNQGEDTEENPSTEQPTTETSTTEMPSTEQPTTEISTTETPGTDQPTTETPTTETPGTEQPTTETLTTETPSTDQPTTETPTTETSTTKIPDVEKTITETPLVPNSTADKTTQNQSSTETSLLPVGSVQTVSGVAYKVTKSTTDTKEVTYTAPTNKKKTSIKVPDTVNISGQIYKVTAIADKAFKNNSKLKSVTIGKNITKIGKEAFSGCKKLSKIIIKSTKLKTVGKNAIKGINKKATIKVPKKQLTKYKKLFKSKTGYKKSMKIKK